MEEVLNLYMTQWGAALQHRPSHSSRPTRALLVYDRQWLVNNPVQRPLRTVVILANLARSLARRAASRNGGDATDDLESELLDCAVAPLDSDTSGVLGTVLSSDDRERDVGSYADRVDVCCGT